MLPLLDRPFLVHQMIDRLARRHPCAAPQPQRDADAEQRIRARNAQILIQHQRDDDREVEIEVRFIMQVVRANGEAACARDHALLIKHQRETQHNGDERNADAFAGPGG